MFERSMRTYQNNMEAKKPDVKEIICKYIYALECLAPRFGSETFAVRHLRLSVDDDDTSPDASRADGEAETAHELMVSANTGIQWREMMSCEQVCHVIVENVDTSCFFLTTPLFARVASSRRPTATIAATTAGKASEVPASRVRRLASSGPPSVTSQQSFT